MKKILIVDDEAHVRKLVAASLRKKQFRLFQAESGQKALQLAVEEAPDLIIMDFRLNDTVVDGLTTMRLIRNHPSTCACKILMISGVNEMTITRALRAGADDFMSKPFSPIRLRERIDELLGS